MWRRSPDLPCRYSYRHRVSTPRDNPALCIDKSVNAADVGVCATSPPGVSLSRTRCRSQEQKDRRVNP